MVNDDRQMLVDLIKALPVPGSVYPHHIRKRWLYAATCLLDLLYEDRWPQKPQFDPYIVFAAGYIKSVSKEMRGNR